MANTLRRRATYGRLRVKQFLRGGRRPEIRPSDFFGRSLQRVIRAYRPTRMLEIGTWDGRGSTTCLLSKLNYEPEWLHCVEVVAEKAQAVQQTLVPLYPFIEVHNRSTIRYEDWSYRDFDALWATLPEALASRLNRAQLYQHWVREKAWLEQAEEPSYFQCYPDLVYDFVLIDGGEFTAVDEVRLLENRFNVIALDDVYNAFKGYFPYLELLQDPDFELIAYSRFVRRGFAIFARRDAPSFARDTPPDVVTRPRAPAR